MVRNNKIDWFMHHAETCKSEDSTEYDTQGAACTIEAAKYIKSLEESVLMLQCLVGDLSEELGVIPC